MSVGLETIALTKTFGNFTALNGVDIAVNEGEVFGFIGPNGAGKTTTIRILLGMLRASGGSARVFGMDAWSDAVKIHRRIAYVPGDVNLWHNLTGGEVIDFLVSLRGVPVDKKRRQNLMERFGFDPSKKCGTYSKGNRQKVALIAAFTSDADLFILDEPTSGLDPLMEQVFQDLIAEQKSLGKCILLSSHILSEVEKLCDRVGIIREGKIVETGSLDQLRHLTRANMYVETQNPIDGLDKICGVHGVAKRGAGLAFQADSDHISEIVAFLAKYNVLKIESVPPTLEDLFMRHYEAKE